MDDASQSQITTKIVDAVKQVDPHFVLASFQTRVATIFFAVQKARRLHQIALAKSYMTADMETHLTNQIHNIQQNNAAIPYYGIGNIELIAVNTKDKKPTITCKINTIQLDKKTNTSSSPEYMYWTFTLLQQQETNKNICEHCGAPIDNPINQVCKYCKSLLSANRLHWLLSSMQAMTIPTE